MGNYLHKFLHLFLDTAHKSPLYYKTVNRKTVTIKQLTPEKPKYRERTDNAQICFVDGVYKHVQGKHTINKVTLN